MDLWITKLRAPLPALASDAASYASGRVRRECIEGLERLCALRAATWARHADEWGLFPAGAAIGLIDKKFGGELSKADVLGVEAEEESDDEGDDGAAGGKVGDGRSVARSHRSSRSGHSLRWVSKA